MVKKYYIYVLQCCDNSLYCGYTNDVYKRFIKHQLGKGTKYTRSHLPVKLLYYKEFTTKHLALSAEYKFKHQSRYNKIKYLKKYGINIQDN